MLDGGTFEVSILVTETLKLKIVNITRNYLQIWWLELCIVGGVNGQNSIVKKCPCI